MHRAVVFFSFWQGLVIAGLAHAHLIPSTLDYTQEEVSAGVQDLLICIEMCFAAVAHRNFFSSRDFFRYPEDAAKNGAAPLGELVAAGAGFAGAGRALRELLPGDVVREAGSYVKEGVEALKPKVLLSRRARVDSNNKQPADEGRGGSGNSGGVPEWRLATAAPN